MRNTKEGRRGVRDQPSFGVAGWEVWGLDALARGWGVAGLPQSGSGDTQLGIWANRCQHVGRNWAICQPRPSVPPIVPFVHMAQQTLNIYLAHIHI